MVSMTKKGELEFEGNVAARKSQNLARSLVDTGVVLRSGLPNPCAPGSGLNAQSAQEAEAIAERFTHAANQVMAILNSGDDPSKQHAALRAAVASARPGMSRSSGDS